LVNEIGPRFSNGPRWSDPNDEKQKLKQTVAKAHAQGRRVLFGHADDGVWKELLDAGVDWLNADDLAGLQAFC